MGRLTTPLLASTRLSGTYPLDSVNCESALIPAGRDVKQQAEIQSIQILL
jgi:hypothetical protein